MKTSQPDSKTRISSWRLLGYALGDGASCIAFAGVANFALLYYTSVLGLGPGMAGLALSISVFYDAITDPLMGHISDNTRSRWGRRLPYVLVGGLLLAPAFFSIWILPANSWPVWLLFVMAVASNLLMRTAVTIFAVPYVAMGFELCPDYEDRSRLQGIRSAFFMVINLLFGGCAWILFFRDRTGPDGARIDGSTIAANYVTMGSVLTATIVLLILACTWFNRDLASDTRQAKLEGNSLHSFWADFSQILRDRLAWYVFGFFSIAMFGFLFVSQLQMFVYVFFMEFRPEEKTFVHGGTMVAAGLGALLQAKVTHFFDKKAAGYVGMVIGILGGLWLLLVFTWLGLAPRAEWVVAGWTLPVGLLLFAFGQWMWWLGAGMLGPVSMSMIADISEIHYLKSGVRKDGGYSSIFSFLQKAAQSVGLLISGWLIAGAGIVSGADTQDPEAVRWITMITFIIGPVLMAFAFVVLWGYPVTRESLRAMEQKSGAQK